MSNVTPLKIDITDGRLPIKEKGLVFQEFASPAEERRNQLEKFKERHASGQHDLVYRYASFLMPE